MGPDSYTIHYGDDGMFYGHSIFVTSFDVLAFLDAHAELFG